MYLQIIDIATPRCLGIEMGKGEIRTRYEEDLGPSVRSAPDLRNGTQQSRVHPEMSTALILV